MFGIELFVPFLIFAPRRLRQWACLTLVFFQMLIFLTGNYCFFNLLTIALCLLLLDDAALRAFLPERLREALLVPSAWPEGIASTGGQLSSRAQTSAENGAREDARPPLPVAPGQPQPKAQPLSLKPWRWPIQITLPLAAIAVGASLMQFSVMFRLPVPWPRPLVAVYRWLEPFRTFNHYGLFAVMTTSRREIIIEGSDDRVTWRAYEFKYKPGDVRRRPRFVEPHQPRLDWQMWFAALGDYRQNLWLVNCCLRLLTGSPPALALLERNPFPQHPPRYIRAVVYEYRFTDFATRRRTGAWWRREEKGLYLPPLSLSNQGDHFERTDL
jgi:hypothetical protein